MLEKIFAVAFLLALPAAAQDNEAPKAPPPASIRGTVTVSGTGAPMPDVELFVNRGTPKEGHAVTDANGRYVLKGLAPGSYQVSANAPDASGRIGFGPSAARRVEVTAGQELEGFDFQMVLMGQISGRVLDQNKEPVPGASVFLVVHEYVSGVLRAVYAGAGTADDQGEYQITRVQPGRPYFLLAKRVNRNLPAISDAPADPKLRRPAVIPTFYPNSRSLDGAQAMVLRPGEQREGIDIRLAKTPSFCLDGVVEGAGGPGVRFEIRETSPTSGSSSGGGMYTAEPGGRAGADGKIRVCDLHPGDYELSAMEYKTSGMGYASFGTAVVTIADRDVQNVRVGARPHLPFAGQVVWDGPAPETPADGKLNLQLQALSRTERGFLNLDMPGEFSLEGGLLMDDFAITVRGFPKGVYLKDITYGGHSVMYEPLRLGSAMAETGVRIALARNGGTAAIRVTDKDGNPVSDCTVVLMPESAANEAVLSMAMLTGKTDLRGTWSSGTLAPGKYFALATNDRVDKTPEGMVKLWRMRTGAYEVEIAPAGSAAATITPRALE